MARRSGAVSSWMRRRRTRCVYLDGQFLGAAGELIALALPVAFGPHLLQVVAPGFHPWAERFFADGSFPTRIRATLARQ